MEVFNLKRGNTLPPLDVICRKPDGSIQDLTGTTTWKLRIILSTGVTLVRTMTKVGADAEGHLRYTWIASDWNAASSPDTDGSFMVGGLVAGPTLPLRPGQREHRFEAEVTGTNGVLTFPNGGDTAEEAYNVLRIWEDIKP